MYFLSKHSKTQLATLDDRFKPIINKVLKIMDIRISEGHRTRATHESYLKANPPVTKVPYEKTKHSTYPSLAVDIDPCPINFKDLSRYFFLAGLIRAFAEEAGIKIRWGGDWDSDSDFKDQTFNDLRHWEIIN